MEEFLLILDQLENIYEGASIESIKQLWIRLYVLANRLFRNEKSEELTYALKDRITQLEQMPFYINSKCPEISKTIYEQDYIKQLSCSDINLYQLDILLDTIVTKTRLDLVNRKKIDIQTDPLTKLCMDACNYICYNFRDFDVMEYKAQNCFAKNINHSFVVVTLPTTIGVKKFVIDPTFRQFCLISRCVAERVLNPFSNYLLPGYFLNDQKLLEQILYKGYFEVDEFTSVKYADAFIMASKSVECSKQKKLIIPKKTIYPTDSYFKSFSIGKRICDD